MQLTQEVDDLLGIKKVEPIPSKPTEILRGRMANYRTQMMFDMPREIVAVVQAWIYSEYTSLGDGMWEIKRSSRRGARLCEFNSGTGVGLTFIHRTPNTTDVFGMSPADYMLVDDRIIVSVVSRETVILMNPRKSRMKTEPVAPATPATAEAQPEAKGPPPAVDVMRDILNQIRTIEAATPYRLVRDGDEWGFAAPIIK